MPIPPTNVVFANNIFSQPDDDLFSDPTGTETWIGNIGFGSLGMSKPAGIEDIDPKLEGNGAGFLGLATDSPAIDAAEVGYPAIPQFPGLEYDHEVALDLMQQQRPSEITEKDLGCSEYPHDITIEPHATEDNTGPSYLWDGQTLNLQLNIQGEGTVELNPPYGIYEEDTEVTLTATPANGFAFDQWIGDLSGDTNPETILMDEDKEVTASFVRVVTDLEDLADKTPSSLRVYPNPANNVVNVSLRAESDSWIKMDLFDLVGTRVQSIPNQSVPEGEFTFTQHLSDIPDGIYMLRINITDVLKDLHETQVVKLCKK